MKNGKLVATLGAVALVAAVGLGSTLAYLTDTTKTVTNTFTFGNVSFNEELNGGLMESEVERNAAGKYVDADGENNWESTGEDYEKLYPGEKVYKDPTVIMSSTTDDAWVFAKVVYNKSQYTITYANGWTVNNELSGSNYDFVVRNDAISKNQTSTIFTAVTVKNDVAPSATLEDIVVSAAAVQKVGFNTAADAQNVAADLLTPATAAPAED